MSDKPKIDDYIFTRQAGIEASLATAKVISANMNRALPSYIPDVQDYFAPVLPGETVVIIGQTSHGKSMFMEQWAEAQTRDLAQSGRVEIPIYIHLEDTVESVMWAKIARRAGITVRQLATGAIEDWGKISIAAADVQSAPMLHIAYSLTKPNLDRCLDVAFICQCIERALDKIKKPGFNPVPASIWLDYLQILAENDGAIKGVNDQRRLRVRGNFYSLRGMGQKFQCPIIIAVQAKQVLAYPYTRELPIPGIYDGEETSAIAQNTDRAISVCMPKNIIRSNGTFKFCGQSYTVKDNYQFCWVTKQRGGLPSGRCFLLTHNYEKGTCTSIARD